VIIKATINVHQDVERTFKKTAVNFHYEFNVRHLTNVFQGVLMARQDIIKEPDNLVKLWAHECERIYGDRLVNAEHLAAYKAFCADICKKQFPRVAMAKYYQPTSPEPLVFANFVESLDDKKYDQFPDVAKLTERLTQGLNAYNEFNAVMDLVLFEDAMKHVCKVSRIISNEAGHALLVGVGGSGKQSLARLASNMSNYTVKQIMISSSYGLADLKVDEQDMYMKCGTKDEGITFLFTEGQITNERFLVSLNDLLSSGEIADLFPVEDIDNIVNTVRGAVKSEGIVDSKDNCWKFFLDRVRRNLHMALCFSPVGDAFRNRAKKFPALINSTVIDFFHPWPKEALLSVAARFLEEVEMPSEEVRDAVVRFMPFSFEIVGQQSELIKDEERRYIYTTPKSFLELIKLFKAMLTTKKNYLEDEKTKYEIGVGKLQQTEEIVAQLEADLKIQSIEVEAIKIEANEKATVVGAEKEIVDVKAAQAEKDSAEANKIKDEVETLLSSVQKDLDNAIPLVEKAKAALNALKKEDFQTLKVLGSPPDDIKKTFMAVQHLYSGIDELVPVDKKGKLTLTDLTDSWKLAQKMMGNPVKFMEGLLDYSKYIDEGKVPPQNFKQIKEQVEDPEFTKEALNVKSTAAGGVCDWIKNIYMYYDVVVNVEPKRLAVLKGKEDLAAASEKKATSEALVKELNEKLAVLMAEYQEAVDKKQKAEETAAYCAERLSRANRLVGALGAEKERWGNSIIQLGAEVDVVTGDVLMSSAFVSYVGPFSKKFRERIIDQMFMKFFKDNAIPFSDGLDPLRILTNEAEIAQWNNDKLPTDSVSVQNGAILTASERYPLMIDPQL
jgi:dynein heavy chain